MIEGCGELIVLEESEGRTENGVCGISGDYCDKCANVGGEDG